MDGGFRSPRSGERRPDRRPSLAQQPASPQNPTVEPGSAPRPVTFQATQGPGRRGDRRLVIVLCAVVATLLVAGAVLWFLHVGQRGTVSSSIDESKYQAVFLDSGQIYFGKLEIMGDGYLRLGSVFYIQPSPTADGGETETNTSASSGDMKLIKLGDEVHGPEDEMIINPDQVLFFENLKPNSKVSELIKQYRPVGK